MFDYVKQGSNKGLINSHICNIYTDDKERLNILSSFVISGIENKEKILLIVPYDQRDYIFKELSQYIEMDEYLQSQQVEIISLEEFFLDAGCFSPYRVILKLKEFTSSLISEGQTKLRVASEMSWLGANNDHITQDFLNFERYITEFCVEDNCLFLDQFDKNQIDLKLLTDIFLLHPIAIIGTEFFNKTMENSNQENTVNKLRHGFESNLDLRNVLEVLEFRKIEDLHIWNAFSQSEKPALVLDETKTILNYNAAMESLTGYQLGEINDLDSWLSILVPDMKKREAILTIVEEPRPLLQKITEIEIQRRDDEKRWIEFSAHEIYRRDSPTNLIILQGIDITVRKRKEERLLFQARLLDSVQESIVAINLNKKIIYWGKGARDLYGYQAEEILGSNISITFPEEKKSKEFQKIIKTVEKETWKGQIKQKRKNGTIFWAGSRISLVKDQNSFPCGFLKIDVDITGYKQTESDLKLSEQKYRNIFNSSPFGMIEYQLMEDGRLVFLGANPAAGDILKVKTNQFIGKTIEEAFPPLSKTEIPENYRRVARTGQVWKLEQITYEDTQIKGIYEVVAFQTEPMKMVASFRDKTSSELAKRQLKESEERYQSLIANIPGVTWISTSTGHTNFVSKNISDIYGYSPEEIYQAGRELWFNRIHPEDLERVKVKFNNLLEKNASFDIEYRIRRKDGEYIWLHDRGLMVYEEEGEKCAYGVFFDITTQKHSELLVENSEEKYRNLFNNANDAIYLFEILPNGEIGLFIEVNDIACQRLEYTKEELLNMTPLDVKTDEENKKLKKMGKKIFDLVNKPFETAHVTKNGRKIPVEINSHLFSLSNRQVGLSISRDITDRKKVEEELRQAKNKYQLLIENLQEGVILESLDHQFSFVNSKICELLEYTENELIGKYWNLIIPVEEFARIKLEFEKLSLNPKRTFESTLLTKEGALLPVIVNTTPIYSDHGALNGYLSVVTDISILKQAEEDRSNFVTMASHELRTPLTIIRGSTEFLENHFDKINEYQRKKCLGTVMRNIRRLERLVTGVLDISKIENNNFSFDLKDVEICKFMKEQEKVYRKHLKNQIMFSLPPGSFNAYANMDKDRIRFVIDNLIENAVKHTSNDFRKINVRTEIFPNVITISVEDNGTGILPENYERIFEQFVSLPSKYSVIGTGIGLFIAKQTMIAHGGSLTVRSDGIDKGSTFTLTLPRVFGTP